MTDKIVKHTGDAIVPDASNMRMIAKDLLDSGMFTQVKSIAGAITIIEYGRELGIPPVAALNTFAIVSGRLTMESKVMLALFIQSGGQIEILQKDKKGSKVKFTKPGHKPYTDTFTIEDAQALGFTGKTNWKNYPEEMCYWRCIAKGIRAFDPMVVMGIYSKEEMQDVTPQKNYTETPPNVGEMPDALKTEEEIADAEIVEEDNGFSPQQEEEDVNPATAQDPDESDEIAIIVADIKQALDAEFGLSTKKATTEATTKFKKWLYVYQDTVGTHGKKYVGKNAFGHESFGAGKLEDLRTLLKEIHNAVREFNKEK